MNGLFHQFIARIWLIALCSISATAGAVIMLMRQVPLYQASSLIELSGASPTDRQSLTNKATIQQVVSRMNVPDEVSKKSLREFRVVSYGEGLHYMLVVISTDPGFSETFANEWASVAIQGKANSAVIPLVNAKVDQLPTNRRKLSVVLQYGGAGVLIGLALTFGVILMTSDSKQSRPAKGT